MKQVFWIIIIMVLGCTIRRPSPNRQSEHFDTDIKSLQEYYPDSLQLFLVTEPSRMVGSYSYNEGFHMRFLSIDSSRSYVGRQWTDTEGRSGKITGTWETKDATIFLKTKAYQEVFDVIDYRGKILLVPIANRKDVVSCIYSVEKLKRKYLQNHTEDEWVEDSETHLINYFSHYGIFTKD